MFQVAVQRMSISAPPSRILMLALGLTAFTLGGCSSPKSEMADAINKSLSAKPETETIYASVKLPQLTSGAQNESNGALGLVLSSAQPSPTSKALSALASAHLIEAKPVAVYSEKNPNSYMSDATLYIPAPNQSEMDSNKAKAILKQIEAENPGTVWKNLGNTGYPSLGGNGYVSQSATFDGAKMGKTDPDFLIAVRKNNSSTPLAKQLAKLAEKGYLRVEDKHVYISYDGPIVGEWTGDPEKVRYVHKPETLLYFTTDKAKGLIERHPAYVGAPSGAVVPAVKLADGKVLKLVTLDTQGKNLFGQEIATVNFEEVRTLTGINASAGLNMPDPPTNHGKPMVSQVKIVGGKLLEYKPSNLESIKPIHAILYSVPTTKNSPIKPRFGSGSMSVDLGSWKLKSVDNFSKDKNPMFGGQVAQCSFHFEYDSKIKPLIKQLAALGVPDKELPKPGDIKPYDCIVTAMEKGYTSPGCGPASKSSRF